MIELGWHWAPTIPDEVEFSAWDGPASRERDHVTVGDLVPRTVATLRQVLGAISPQQIVFTAAAYSHRHGRSPSYVDAELGIARERPSIDEPQA